MIQIYVVSFLLILISSSISAEWFFPPLHQISLEPEVSHLRREREGGSVQKGEMGGILAKYERLGRYRWYLGIEGLYSKGTLKGHTRLGDRLKSTLTDERIEGRLGYTFQGKVFLQPAFTPFIGYGYFQETNHFRNPSPLKLKFIHHFPYFTSGFLSSITILPCFTIGANAYFSWMNNGKCNVKDDPDFEHVHLRMKDKMQYRFEIPLQYLIESECFVFGVGCVPFYEFHHFGGRENYPFDFLETRIKTYGLRVQLSAMF